MPSNYIKREFTDNEEPAIDSDFLNDLQDEVIDIGNKAEEGAEIQKYEDGYVIKYPNGVMEQVKEKTLTANITQAWSNLYVSQELDLGNWYEEFIEAPFVSYKLESGTYACGILEKGTPLTQKIPNINIFRNSSVTISVTIKAFAKGFWK